MMKISLRKIMAAAGLCAIMCVSVAGCGKKAAVNEDAAAFTPRLDTQEETTLEIAGFMGNFEALDKVVNDFNEIYPNVTISYEQNNTHLLRNYLDNNTGIDIFMTTDENIRYADTKENYVGDKCVDLSDCDIDLSAVSKDIISCGMVDGQLTRIPILKNLCGMAVNKSLLEKEGLSIPSNYSEFLDVLDKLKNKGYTPIQSSANHVYSELVINMAMDMIADDAALRNAIAANESSAVDKLTVVFERLQTIIDKGYTDYDINKELPSDNYDASIMNFFEGNVPFWVCNTESFSGTKKRESKSQTYSSNSFEYEYMYVPMGHNGAYEFIEPWYGFSVCKDSDNMDYAIEFMRFMMTEQELNNMGAIKGMPSIAVNGDDVRYQSLYNTANIQESFANDGTIDSNMKNIFTDVCSAYGKGDYSTPKEAAQAFVNGYAAVSSK